MVPEKVLPYTLSGDRIEPGFLDAADLPWVELVADEYARFAQRPKRALDEHFRAPLPFESPPYKRRLLLHCLGTLWRTKICAACPPARVRQAVCLTHARLGASRSDVIEQVADELEITPEQVDEALFADLRGERVLVPPEEPLSPRDLALKANLLIAQGLLCRSTSVQLWLQGNARRIVRHAKLKGLICTVVPTSPTGEARLDISGPLSLFRRTTMYGRALAELIPYLGWCHRYRLRAEVISKGEALSFELASGARVLPSTAPKRFDSRLEDRFARDFAKLTTEWSIIRECDPIQACGTLIFPDFALVHRAQPGEKWMLEILGFWTPEYLERKLRQYRDARLERLILCIDETRQCDAEQLPENAKVLRYRRRIDAQQVLDFLLSEPTSVRR